MTPQFHERQILRPRTQNLDSQQLMRVTSAKFNANPDTSEYLIEPCEGEYPHKSDPLAGGLVCLSGAQVHQRYEVAAEAPC